MTAKDNKKIIAMYKELKEVADFSLLEPDIEMTTTEWFLNIYDNYEFYKDGFYKILTGVLKIIEESETNKISHELFIAPGQLMSYNNEPVILPRLIFNQNEDSDFLEKKNALLFTKHVLGNYDTYWDLVVLSLLILIAGANGIISSSSINKSLYVPEKERIKLFLLFRTKISMLYLQNNNSELKSFIDKCISEIDLGSGSEITQLRVPFKLKPSEISLDGKPFSADPRIKAILLQEDFTRVESPLISNPPVDYKKITDEIIVDYKKGSSFEKSIIEALLKL